ncbi:MAG TPA: glycosyltransferase [Rhodocyclaceae bacterium]|nr:glycosyltransferase [Rhodocyclaceae bacterium]
MLNTAAHCPTCRENGRVVVFRGCWNMTPLVNAFERLGYEAWVDRPDADLAQLSRGDVVACITNIHTDIKRPLGFLSVKKRINRLGAPMIFWDRDGPSHMGEKAWRIWLLKHVEFMDAYATHTMQDAGKFAGEVVYLPNAAWDERYNLGSATLEALRDPAHYRYDVSFFGRIDPRKFPETVLRARFVDKLKPMLEAKNLRHLFTDGDLPIEEQVELIQTSVINLSFFAGCDVRYQGGYHGEPFSWGLPERCYGVPACGGFLLSDQRAHAADDFTEGTDWVAFSDLEDCVAKITHYVGNFAESRRIAEAAHHRVMSAHRYIDRANKLLRFCLYWKQKKRLISVPSGI